MFVNKNWIASKKNELANDHSLAALKVFLILWAIGVIVAALMIKNKLALAGLILYEVLP